MHHVAIMKPKLHLLEKIVSGQKTIESRWLHQRRAPWHQVRVGDTIYFKNSGQPVSASASVSKVLYVADLTPNQVRQLVLTYGEAIGLENIEDFYMQHQHKRYAVFIWLDQVRQLSPFTITKQGFGAQSAWLTTPNIASLRIKD
ncbi:MAG TPA: hypothetical protein VFZ58_00495 [Candidatus Saccharimonadales bacterium]